MNKVDLPVLSLRSTFQTAILKQPVVITAPTGSGKSTQVPGWCADVSEQPVLVVEPRRVACRSLARWLSKQRGEPLGTSVGYTVRFEDVTSKATRIRFVTPGVALRYAVSGELHAYDTIIIDEFHERGMESDLFLAICRKKYPDAKLALMSATINAKRLAQFLNGTALSAEGRVYSVDVRYLGDVTVPAAWHLPQRVERGVRRALRETDGDILVFLPGKGEIASCLEQLQHLRGVEVLPLHGNLPTSAQDLAFEVREGRRIILATNVAETSITLPGITAVVDSGLVRQRIHQAQRVVLALRPISQASAEQRRGRAGRLAPGVCYRLWERQGQLERETPPEILREDLTQFVLAVTATGFRPQELDFLDAPPTFAVERAQQDLKKWGVLSEAETLTNLGKRLYAVPVDVSYARLLVKAPTSVQQDLVDLVSTLERPAPLWRRLDQLPPDAREPIIEARQTDLFRQSCDATALILALRRGEVKRHYLHSTALAECRRIASQLRSLLELPDAKRVKPDRRALIHYLLREWPDCAYVRRKKGKAWGNGRVEVLLASDSLTPSENNAVLILETEGIANGTHVQLVGRTAMSCTFADLLAAGFGTTRVRSPTIDGDDVVAEVSFVYAGRELEREQRTVSGLALREALADLILSGRLFPNVAKRLTESIDAYNLYMAISSSPDLKKKVENPRLWLLSRLADLGVEASQDWQLLSPNDFAFTEIDEETVAEINARFPREFAMNGAKFHAEFHPERQQVTLKWMSGIRQPTLSSTLLPRWNDWKVHVDLRGQLRTLRS